MEPIHLIAVNGVGVVVLVAGAVLPTRATRTHRLAALALVPAAAAVAMVAFVLSEDDYRDNGTSRWDAYRSPGGELGEVFVGCVAAAVVAAVLIAYGASRRPPQFTKAALLAAAFVLFAFIPITVQLSAN